MTDIDELLEPSTISAPWGYSTVLHARKGFVVKELCVRPGESTSLQSHKHRRETWTISQGNAVITIGNKIIRGLLGDTFKIKINQQHRIENPSAIQDLIIIEVWLGDDLREDDITRYQDRYGRAGCCITKP